MGNKIFITLGSQKFQFNRLLKAVDELCEKGTVDAEDVFAQIGYSDYLPKNFNYKKFLDRDEFSKEMGKAVKGNDPLAISNCFRSYYSNNLESGAYRHSL